jgi:hypothetical protein
VDDRSRARARFLKRDAGVLLVVLVVVAVASRVTHALDAPVGVVLAVRVVSLVALLWALVRFFRAMSRLAEDEAKRNPRPW